MRVDYDFLIGQVIRCTKKRQADVREDDDDNDDIDWSTKRR